MTFYEALNILNIDSKYDEKKLKSAYHRLAKKYHPDQLQTDNKKTKESLEMIKIINLAYETLLDKKDNCDSEYNTSNKSNTEVLSFKLSKINLLEKYKIKKYAHLLSDFTNYINETIILFISREYSTVNEVEEYYQNTINKILSIYKLFEQNFYTKYNIDKNEIVETINYDCSFDDFYERLLIIKEKYSFENKINKIIEKNTEKYKYYAGYSIASYEISSIKNNIYKEIIQLSTNFKENKIDYLLVQNCINKMNKKIETIFTKAFILQKKIKVLKKKVAETKDTNIINNYIILKQNFKAGQQFLKTKHEINSIEQMILIKKNIKHLKHKIEKNYLKDYYLAKDHEKKILVNNIYMNILDYIQSVKKIQEIPESISLLQERDYLGVIDLIEDQVIYDMLEKYNYSKNESNIINNKKNQKYKHKNI